jgi:uncharacterized protein YdbL (DUF1318 family)
MKRISFFWLFVVVALLLPIAGRSEDLNAVKSRIHQRHSQVEALKAQGAVGENNRGFLEARGALVAQAASVVSDENKDREVVYAALAQQTSTTPSQVAKARARQLAQRARPGEWIQDEAGDWKQK